MEEHVSPGDIPLKRRPPELFRNPSPRRLTEPFLALGDYFAGPGPGPLKPPDSRLSVAQRSRKRHVFGTWAKHGPRNGETTLRFASSPSGKKRNIFPVYSDRFPSNSTREEKRLFSKTGSRQNLRSGPCALKCGASEASQPRLHVETPRPHLWRDLFAQRLQRLGPRLRGQRQGCCQGRGEVLMQVQTRVPHSLWFPFAEMGVCFFSLVELKGGFITTGNMSLFFSSDVCTATV